MNRVFLCFLLCMGGIATAQPTRLQCEYLNNPLGIDEPHPRLSWQWINPAKGARQQAYQILVSTDSTKLANAEIWNSGKVASDQQRVSYNGPSLTPYTKYYWTVQVWDQAGKLTRSPKIASFETGLGTQSNWKGAWISDSRDENLKPAPYFRKTFTAGKRIRSARAYVAAAGLYELFVNGKRVGNHFLDPMYTRFDRRTLYVTYDVTQELQTGKNALGVVLGNGWYNHQSTAVWYFDQAPWRSRPSFCMDLRVTYEDGTTETISSDKSWKTSLGPIIFNSIYTAEHYDARLQQSGWNTASFNDTKWKEVMFRPAPSNLIVSQTLHPIRKVEMLPTQSLKQLNDTTWLYDFGRNIAGITEVTVQGEAGTVIRVKHGERLGANGHVDMSNIDAHYRPTDQSDPFQTDIYILSGNPDTLTPHFNYKGFQYAEVTSSRKGLKLNSGSIRAHFMHSDVPPVGTVHTGNETVNKIWWATNNSYLSNLFGYPTDCPQREKNGWTGDGQIAVETGLYNFDGITVYEKWLADHRDEQQSNGVLPSIVPTSGWGYEWGNGPDWTSTIAIIPWNLYLFYGDKKALVDNYSNIKRYVDYITTIAPKGLTTWGLGDWIPVKSKSPVELTSSIYYFVDATILANTAQLLQKPADEQKYRALAATIKEAINAKYFHTETGLYGTGIQSELSIPLQWGVVPEAYRAKVAENLAKRVRADGNSLDVGLLGTKAILNALSENGYADVAYTLASNEKYPSWGWWIKNGATTLYENWPIDAKSDISMNHIMFGEIGAWFYKALGGIKPDPQQPGFKNILLKPQFVKALNQFRCTHEGPYGTIASAWERTGEGVVYQVTVPPNSTATLMLAGKKVTEAGKEVKNPQKISLVAGRYTFLVSE